MAKPSTDSIDPNHVRTLRGVGPKGVESLARLGISTLENLLRHYPSRYVDRRTLRPLGSFGPLDTQATELGEDGKERRAVFTSMGRVQRVQEPGGPAPRRHPGRPGRSGGYGRGGAKSRVVLSVADDSGSMECVFFGGVYRVSFLKPGDVLVLSGPVGMFGGKPQFQNPEFEILDRDEEAALHSGRLFPVYPLTKGLTQQKLRDWVRAALPRGRAITDPLPEPVRARHDLLPLVAALESIHFPESPQARDRARHRLAFEEVLMDQLFVSGVRQHRETGREASSIPSEGPFSRRIEAALPFTLTADQTRVLAEIRADLEGPRPMNRMLQGDVGSGKTVVAFLAAAAAADAGVQSAFMVPTEILAEQHHRTLNALGGALGLETRLLVGGMSTAARREVLHGLAAGHIQLVVGTHALFQDEVRFANLGLVVVDEQHRFGVLQRVALLQKGHAPHVLVMSATPIPRTLALVRHADLDLSVIRQRPAGRGRIITRVTHEAKRGALYGFMAERLREGRQAYIIYPLVEESASGLAAATTMARELAKRPEFSGLEIALLHGQMPSEEKDAVMTRFVAGGSQILVATTVVEVGIDVPNASFCVIEHPERYGLSQLHQLRGRIGRGEHTSYCVLVAGPALSPEAMERLALFSRIDDGFVLAEHDLRLRGRGDLVGTRQSGRPAYRLADPLEDHELVEAAHGEARRLLSEGALLDPGADPIWHPLAGRLRDMMHEAGVLLEAG